MASTPPKEPQHLGIQASHWIKLKDFLETKYSVTLKNVSTGAPVGAKGKVEIVELEDSGVMVSVPKRATAMGHHLMIKIVRKLAKQGEDLPREIAITGKVVHEEPVGPGGDDYKVITLQFYQFSEKDWQNFLVECAVRQREVDAIVKKIQE